MNRREPHTIARALSELISLRGLARVRGKTQLTDIWKQVAGESIAAHTRPLEVRRGVLQVAVGNTSLLAELTGFHKHELLKNLQTDHADLKIKDIKFKLRSETSPEAAPP